MTAKKIPLRRCEGCGEQKEKRAMVRVVRTPEGEVVADLTGRKNGRGAYLCRSEACLNKAVKARALERALEQPLSEEAAAYLRQVILGGGNEAL